MLKPADTLNKRKRLFMSMVGIGFAAMAVLALTEKHIPPEIYDPIITVVIGVFLAGVLLMYVGLRCPACRKNLGMSIMYSHEKLKKCPRCGADLGEDGS